MPLMMHLYNPLRNVAYDSLPLWSQSHWKGWLCFHLLAAAPPPLPNIQAPCLVVYIVLLYCSSSKVYWKKTSIVTCKKNFMCLFCFYYSMLFWTTPPNTPCPPNTKSVPTPLLRGYGKHNWMYAISKLWKFLPDGKFSTYKICCYMVL